jgi:pyruvate formate lyase activating enzyme
MLYARTDAARVQCALCAHRCWIEDGQRGRCGVRINEKGTLYTVVYGRLVAQHVDPIEKKPLYHYRPGSRSLSIAAPGCNMRCRWCQNWQISQCIPLIDGEWGEPATPEEIVKRARRSGCSSISYTYTEPTIFFEYAFDVAERASSAGLGGVFVTNGYMTVEALHRIAPLLDAASVDLKAFDEEIHERMTGARLAPVLDTLQEMRRIGLWIEVTTLVVPGVNDDPEQLRGLVAFVAEELGTETPWHVSRFFPAHRMMDVAPTPVETIDTAVQLGREAGLRYIYAGNLGEQDTTRCPGCGVELIRRQGYGRVRSRVVAAGRCPECGAAIPGVDLAETDATS